MLLPGAGFWFFFVAAQGFRRNDAFPAGTCAARTWSRLRADRYFERILDATPFAAFSDSKKRKNFIIPLGPESILFPRRPRRGNDPSPTCRFDGAFSTDSRSCSVGMDGTSFWGSFPRVIYPDGGYAGGG